MNCLMDNTELYFLMFFIDNYDLLLSKRQVFYFPKSTDFSFLLYFFRPFLCFTQGLALIEECCQ